MQSPPDGEIAPIYVMSSWPTIQPDGPFSLGRQWAEGGFKRLKSTDTYVSGLFINVVNEQRGSMRALSMILLLFFLMTSGTSGMCQRVNSNGHSEPLVVDAIEGVLAEFRTHPIVGIADSHGLAQEEDFYVSLVRDRRFAVEVGNVVVEFGDAAQQKTIDRYLAGDEVPYVELRKVWSDTVGWVPTVTSLGYINFFAAVRAVNLTLPAERRINIWLGEPPIDWSKIKTRDDLPPNSRERDIYPAELIRTQILAKNKKALVIYGNYHFHGDQSLRELVDQDQPGALFLINPYTGFTDSPCSRAFEQVIRDSPSPSLATPVRGSSLQRQLQSAGCSGVEEDTFLLLGPAAELTWSPQSPDLYLDPSFRKEIERRNLINFGQALPAYDAGDNSSSPRYLHPAKETARGVR